MLYDARMILSPHLLNPTIIIIIIFFFLFTTTPTSRAQDNEQYLQCLDSLFNCGDTIQDIRYPFWGNGRPRNCGLEEFELTCHNNDYATIDIDSQRFRVLDIYQPKRSMIIARDDLWSDVCPQEFNDITINHTPFTYLPAYENLTLFYDCADEIINTDVRYTFNCPISGVNRRGFYAEYPFSPAEIRNVEPYCGINMTVPVLREAVEEFRDNYTMGVRELVNWGFEVEYRIENNRSCLACQNSGGLCWINSTSLEDSTCLCPNEGVRPRVCSSSDAARFNKRPKLWSLDQKAINRVWSRTGQGLNHPRSAHILLEYTPKDTCFVDVKVADPVHYPEALDAVTVVRSAPLVAAQALGVANVPEAAPIPDVAPILEAVPLVEEIRVPEGALRIRDKGTYVGVEESDSELDDHDLKQLFEDGFARDTEEEDRLIEMAKSRSFTQKRGKSGPGESSSAVSPHKRRRLSQLETIRVSPEASEPAQQQQQPLTTITEIADQPSGQRRRTRVSPSKELFKPEPKAEGRPITVSDKTDSSAVVLGLVEASILPSEQAHMDPLSTHQLFKEGMRHMMRGMHFWFDEEKKMRSQLKTLQDNQAYLRKQSDDDKAKLADQKKENRSLILELDEVKKKLDAANSELTRVKETNVDLSAQVQEAARKQTNHEQELEVANQEGYDQCFEEKLSELRALRQAAYQLGYDFGLTSAGIPMGDPLRIEVVAPPLPADEEGDDMEADHMDDDDVGAPTSRTVREEGEIDTDDRAVVQTSPADSTVAHTPPPPEADPPLPLAESPLLPLAHERVDPTTVEDGAVEDVVAVD